MNTLSNARARAVADLAEGRVLASVDIAAPPERVFRALTSREIADWWVRPGVFDTTEWTGDVRVGGHWRTAGTVRGQAYSLEGEYLEIDPPKKLVHTWQRVGVEAQPSTVTYLLEPIAGGTRLTLRHTGLLPPEANAGVGPGWETSLDRLAEILATGRGAATA